MECDRRYIHKLVSKLEQTWPHDENISKAIECTLDGDLGESLVHLEEWGSSVPECINAYAERIALDSVVSSVVLENVIGRSDTLTTMYELIDRDLPRDLCAVWSEGHDENGDSRMLYHPELAIHSLKIYLRNIRETARVIERIINVLGVMEKMYREFE